ncbi:MAG TPA: hypothetical protein VLD67_07515 [Vicinamibacterales bacterium]|nr:hypothetical protein [Vicinamibacterales bacterium]
MIRRRSHWALVIVSAILLTPSIGGHRQATEALFSLDSPAVGPFPTDWFTVSDHTNKTHRRVSLPLPDCQQQVSDCEDIAVLNELDGFNLQPRLSVPFSGPIDANTVTSDTVFLVSLGSTGPEESMPWGTMVGTDQVVWDTFTNTLHVESDDLLAQHTRFALIVTRGVRDEWGMPVEASDAFRRFRADVREDYKQALLDAVRAARHAGVPEDGIAVASVFTTRSATAVLEKIRDQIRAASPDPADFLLGPAGERTVFALNQVTTIAWRQQVLVNPPYFGPNPVSLNLPLLNLYPGSVAAIAFGRYLSPDYEVHPVEYIPPVGTRQGTPVVQGTNDIYFNLFVPAGLAPADGWPVVILGHGVNNSKNVLPLQVASSMAKHGIATIAINAVGHGFGPLGTLTVNRTAGAPITFPAGGRGIDQNGDGAIGDSEGLTTLRPRAVVALSDGFRQTAVDLMQLARVVEAGMDVDGDGLRDLDPSRMYYLGNSLGGGYGTVFLAVEPGVRAGVIAVPADPVPVAFLGLFRRVAGTMAESRQPSLLNSPGITAIDGLAIGPPFFDENRPLRDRTPLTVDLQDLTTRIIQSPVINTVAGAMAIQAAGENLEWVSQAGSPLAYAPHLRKAPLAGMAPKPVIYQIAKGDQAAGNPSTTAILRAGGLADWNLYYRHDLARAEDPLLPANPHGFLVAVGNPRFRAISLGAQAQAGIFFASDGTMVVHPEPMRFFEVPIAGPLPEGLNYVH